VDKFLWPGLYVGEKFLLTMSFALAVPLATLACVCLLATLLLGRCPGLPSLCPRFPSRRVPQVSSNLPLSGKLGTHETVRARFRPWLSGESP